MGSNHAAPESSLKAAFRNHAEYPIRAGELAKWARLTQTVMRQTQPVSTNATAWMHSPNSTSK